MVICRLSLTCKYSLIANIRSLCDILCWDDKNHMKTIGREKTEAELLCWVNTELKSEATDHFQATLTAIIQFKLVSLSFWRVLLYVLESGYRCFASTASISLILCAFWSIALEKGGRTVAIWKIIFKFTKKKACLHEAVFDLRYKGRKCANSKTETHLLIKLWCNIELTWSLHQ